MSGENTTYERLSSFIDGELGSESRSLVDRMLGDDELKSTWSRYQAIGDVLRREASSLDPSLLENIRNKLAEEPTVLAPKALHKAHPGRFQRIAAGAAIAAGVAAIAVVSVTRLEIAPTAEVATADTQPVAKTQQVATVQLGGSGQPETVAQGPQESAPDFNRYLASHSNFASSGSLNGVMPLATYISYDE